MPVAARRFAWFVGAWVALAVAPASAGVFSWTNDLFIPSDATGGFTYEIFGMGWKIEAGNLELRVDTGFPRTGDTGGTSYGTTFINPGDLYLNLNGVRTGGGGAGGGTVYGLALTSHTGWITNDPKESVLAWKPVLAGHLYKNARFASGSYEGYEGAVNEVPLDAGVDQFGTANNYPTVIADYSAGLGLTPGLSYTKVLANAGLAADNWLYPKNHWRIAATIPLSVLNLDPFQSHTFEAWWSMECGNDGVKVNGTIPATIPEPGTLALLGLGLGTLARRRRRR